MSPMITLISKDSQQFDVEEAVVSQSQTLNGLLHDIVAEEKKQIPVMNVTGNILAKVIQYCKEHVKDNGTLSDDTKMALKQFDSDFVKVDDNILFGLINTSYMLRAPSGLETWLTSISRSELNNAPSLFLQAANYLNIKNLLALTSRKVAERLKGKSPEEIRKTFGIENDYSPKEEKILRSDLDWAFEEEEKILRSDIDWAFD